MSEELTGTMVKSVWPWEILHTVDGQETVLCLIRAETSEKALEEFLGNVDPADYERGLSVRPANKSRRQTVIGEGKDALVVEHVTENPNREERAFDTDAPDVMTMIMGHADWLEEQGCSMEAELLRLDWGMKVGMLAPTADARKRVQELRKYFGILDQRLVHEKVEGQRGRTQTITLFLQEPMGHWYTKATINLLHVEKFLKHLHNQPIMDLVLACNATKAPGLVGKYLKYTWLKKCEKLELNNLDISFVQLRELFKDTVVTPTHLRVTGQETKNLTVEQMQLLPQLCPGLKHLWTIDYHGAKYDYRYAPDKQPK
jgi:hypothetical protein